jgi:hypothetical protein
VLLVEGDGGRARERLLALRAAQRLDVDVLDLVVAVGRPLLLDPSRPGSAAARRTTRRSRERRNLAVLLPDLWLLLFRTVFVLEVAPLLLGLTLLLPGRVLGGKFLLAGSPLRRLVLLGLLALAAVVRAETGARAGVIAVGHLDGLALAAGLGRRDIRRVRLGLRVRRVGRVVLELGGASDEVDLEKDRVRLSVGTADCAVEEAVGTLLEGELCAPARRARSVA